MVNGFIPLDLEGCLWFSMVAYHLPNDPLDQMVWMVGKPQLTLVSTNRFWRDVQLTRWNVNGFQGKPTIATKTGVNANIDIRRLLEDWCFHFTSRGAKPSYISFIIIIIFLISLRRLQAAHFAPPALSSEVGSDDFSWHTNKHTIHHNIYITILILVKNFKSWWHYICQTQWNMKYDSNFSFKFIPFCNTPHSRRFIEPFTKAPIWISLQNLFKITRFYCCLCTIEMNVSSNPVLNPTKFISFSIFDKMLFVKWANMSVFDRFIASFSILFLEFQCEWKLQDMKVLKNHSFTKR